MKGGLFIMTTGEKIKELRKEKGLSLRDVEKSIGIDRNMICLIENNKRNLTVENLLKICRFFNVSADYLVGLKEQIA